MPTISEIQSEIAEIQCDIELLKRELDELMLQFSTDLIPAVREWMNNHLQGAIKRNAATLNAAGLDSLGALKADFQFLTDHLPATCKEAIGSPNE